MVPDDSYVAVDGSGLSRYNYVTAETLTTVLERMYRDPRHHDAFLATLPIAGKDGTAVNAHAPDAGRRERPREDRLHLECPLAFGFRPHPGRRDAGVFDPRK